FARMTAKTRTAAAPPKATNHLMGAAPKGTNHLMGRRTEGYKPPDGAPHRRVRTTWWGAAPRETTRRGERPIDGGDTPNGTTRKSRPAHRNSLPLTVLPAKAGIQ